MAKRIPRHYSKRFTVTTALPSGQTIESDDGMPLHEWSAVGDLLQQVTYVGDLERVEGRWGLVLQWVDLQNAGHRIALPHEVVDRILSHADTIMAQAKSDRSRAGAETREARATESPEGSEDDGISMFPTPAS